MDALLRPARAVWRGFETGWDWYVSGCERFWGPQDGPTNQMMAGALWVIATVAVPGIALVLLIGWFTS